MLRGNKGEWSEAYVMLDILGEGKLHAADGDLKPNPDLHFPVNKVIRKESNDRLIDLEVNQNLEVVEVRVNGVPRQPVLQSRLRKEAAYLKSQLALPHDSAAFSIPQTEYFLLDLGCEKIKAPSSDKTDITLELHDPRTNHDSVCGFSIKSEFGCPSTLLNATAATNVAFRVNGLSDEDIEEINSIEGSQKIVDRMNAIFSTARNVRFAFVCNETFASNLMYIDSKMADIIAHALLVHYRDNVRDVSDIVNVLEEDNPLDFPIEGLYRYKMKKFLCAVALGFQPAHEWDGREEANGGYIIATRNAGVLAYHSYNRDLFEDYLLRSTRFDRGSTARHGYASLYKIDKNVYINLNLQIRF